MNEDIVSHALVVETAKENRFVSIDVDFDVKSTLSNNVSSDVLFVGTSNLKNINDINKKLFF